MGKPSSKERHLASQAPYNPEPFVKRLGQLVEDHNESLREAATRSGLDYQSVRRYLGGRRPHIMACVLLANHYKVNPNELLTLAGWPALEVFEIDTESAEKLPPEAVDVARDVARIADPGLRQEVAQAIRTLLRKYFA